MQATSVIHCPVCGFEQEQTMPADYCQIAYTCPHCQTSLRRKHGDCCVYCSYGSARCPSQQQVRDIKPPAAS